MAIFQKSVIKKHINNLDKEQVEKAYQKFRDNYSPAKIEKIKHLKEEEYQDGFLRDLFVDVFGYTLKPDDNYNLAREFKNQADGKKADGAILKNNLTDGLTRQLQAVAVIELKSTKTKDLKSITEQAFNYKNNQPDCKYVITSNFQKLRFYIDYANEFEEFDLFQIANGSTDGLTRQFETLYLILNTNSIFSDLPLKLKKETKFHEQEISNKLYNDYSDFKNKLFKNLIKNNPEYDKLTLFKKSQKLLDRFLFILFAEDSGLLPPNSISRIIKRYEILKEEDAYKPLYNIFKQYFGYMNIGRKGQTDANNIPAYNGGLFYPDELLNNLKIDDKILINDLLNLSKYDFNTEIDVNILGHIFEHSLSEIEEITAEIEGTTTDKTKSKRKKDGVFYTPKYITQYIVENTIGTLCNKKRKELEIEEIEFDGTYRTKAGKLSEKGKKLYQKLNNYKDWLLSLKIVDPACGSGAFLNQALNFLIQEHKNIDDIIAELTNTTLRLFDTDKAILENNLYGVDINEESVEIAKLSLWLRTAQKGRKLSVLSNNIKCGNSLIDDPEVAGDKAFDWKKEFPQIFKEKKKKSWHVTTAIHNSRYSQRMFDYNIKTDDATWLSEKDEIIITETIAKIVKEDNLNVVEYNICGDHMHLLLICEEEELTSIIGKIKGKSSRLYHNNDGINPLVQQNGEKSVSLWTQKFGKSEIKTEDYLNNTVEYIRNNRIKHELPKSEKIKKIKKEFLCTKDHAFRTEYKGGFDVVIGNPPYVNVERIDKNERNYLLDTYDFIGGRFDLYVAFMEKVFNLLKEKGNFSFIIPYPFLYERYAEKIRKEIVEKYTISSLLDLSNVKVFEDAIVRSIVFVIHKKPTTENNIKIAKFDEKRNNIYLLKHHLLQDSIKDNPNYSYRINLTKEKLSIIKKILKNSLPLSDFFYVNWGARTGNIKKYVVLDNSLPYTKKMINGRNVKRYFLDYFGEYIIYDKPKLYNPMFEELFDNPKIFIPDVSGKKGIRAVYDGENFYAEHTVSIAMRKDRLKGTKRNNKLVIEEDLDFDAINSIDEKYVLSLLNSKLLNFFFLERNGGGLHVYPQNVKQLPIKKISSDEQKPFIEKADKMLSLNKRLQEKKTKFLNRVKDNLISVANSKSNSRVNPAVYKRAKIKISKKLDTFYDYDFKTFVTEINKVFKTNGLTRGFTLVQQDEWEEYFTAYKTEINNLQNEINKTDKEIDLMVYELYELTEEEVGIIENNIN